MTRNRDATASENGAELRTKDLSRSSVDARSARASAVAVERGGGRARWLGLHTGCEHADIDTAKASRGVRAVLFNERHASGAPGREVNRPDACTRVHARIGSRRSIRSRSAGASRRRRRWHPLARCALTRAPSPTCDRIEGASEVGIHRSRLLQCGRGNAPHAGGPHPRRVLQRMRSRRRRRDKRARARTPRACSCRGPIARREAAMRGVRRTNVGRSERRENRRIPSRALPARTGGLAVRCSNPKRRCTHAPPRLATAKARTKRTRP